MDDWSTPFRKPAYRLLLPALFLLIGVVPSDAWAQSMAQAAQGQKIFFKVCVQCHTLQQENQPSGPGLAGVLDRVPSEEWLMNWLEDPEKMVNDGDSYAQEISGDYPLEMPTLKVMEGEANRKAILTFLKQMREQNQGRQ